MVQSLKERPPYVTFVVRSEEDRQATLEKKCYIGRDVIYAVITPTGSKDKIERQADEWIAHLYQESTNGRIPAEWHRQFSYALEQFRKGQSAEINGTPLRTWTGISPSQLLTLESLGIFAVEDLAAANESALNAIGMGARTLRQSALDWLAQRDSPDNLLKELEKLRAANDNLAARNVQLEANMAELRLEIAPLLKDRPQQVTEEV